MRKKVGNELWGDSDAESARRAGHGVKRNLGTHDPEQTARRPALRSEADDLEPTIVAVRRPAKSINEGQFARGARLRCGAPNSP